MSASSVRVRPRGPRPCWSVVVQSSSVHLRHLIRWLSICLTKSIFSKSILMIISLRFKLQETGPKISWDLGLMGLKLESKAEGGERGWLSFANPLFDNNNLKQILWLLCVDDNLPFPAVQRTHPSGRTQYPTTDTLSAFSSATSQYLRYQSYHQTFEVKLPCWPFLLLVP